MEMVSWHPLLCRLLLEEPVYSQAEQPLVISDTQLYGSCIGKYQAVAIPLADIHIHIELAQALPQPCFLTQQVRRSRLMVLCLLLVDSEFQLLPVVCPYIIQGRCCACVRRASPSRPLQVVQSHNDSSNV